MLIRSPLAQITRRSVVDARTAEVVGAHGQGPFHLPAPCVARFGDEHGFADLLVAGWRRQHDGVRPVLALRGNPAADYRPPAMVHVHNLLGWWEPPREDAAAVREGERLLSLVEDRAGGGGSGSSTGAEASGPRAQRTRARSAPAKAAVRPKPAASHPARPSRPRAKAKAKPRARSPSSSSSSSSSSSKPAPKAARRAAPRVRVASPRRGRSEDEASGGRARPRKVPRRQESPPPELDVVLEDEVLFHPLKAATATATSPG